MNILVVDDKQVIIQKLSKVLTQLSHEVDSAVNGLDALEKMKKNDYDLYIIDHLMPLMDGIQLAKNIKQQRQNVECKETPIIFMTTKGKETVNTLPESQIFNAIINKPIDEIELLNCVTMIENCTFSKPSIAINE